MSKVFMEADSRVESVYDKMKDGLARLEATIGETRSGLKTSEASSEELEDPFTKQDPWKLSGCGGCLALLVEEEEMLEGGNIEGVKHWPCKGL